MKSLFSLLLLPVAISVSYGSQEKNNVDYLRDVKPILAAKCFACHGAVKQRGGLRVDTAVLMQKGGDSGAAFTPRNAGKSLLIKRLLGAGGLKRMPPKSDSEPLAAKQIDLIHRWIDQGAKAPENEIAQTDPKEHWAFKKPVRPTEPKPKNKTWIRNPIDAFIAAKHESLGLKPQPAVGKRLLLRRVYLDLIGLPPTRKEMNDFINDKSPKAYEKVVDRLLNSPQYGERWGRHWMDIWRYSDWWGLGQQLRNSQKHIWHWRDWIVESLNKDKGYDRMVLEMLAADELYPTDADALRGTGFLARQYYLFNRTTWMDETIEHTNKAFLGLTMNCAKCHDHKYDPIRHEDYYRFRAFFEPYQVRLDQVPGQTDFKKDGIPRIFDCNLDTPTFLHIRGNEQMPDKKKNIAPGLPGFFARKGLQINPVKLPPEAVNPGLRLFVLEDLLQAAQTELAAARNSLEVAKRKLALTEKKQPRKKTNPVKNSKLEPIVLDEFKTLNKEVWQVGAGDWKFEKGKLIQRQAGNQRAALFLKTTPPADFEVRFQFAILGGEQWKSVGIVFDDDGKKEYLVYLTAHQGDQRIQFSYKNAGKQIYPKEIRQRRKVDLGQPQEIRLRVRGTLLNVSVNGKHAFATNLPLGRLKGRLSLITFDAKARFERFALSALPNNVQLVKAGTKSAAPTSVTGLRAAAHVAEKQIAAAEQKIITLKARAAAGRAALAKPAKDDAKKLARQAALAEKKLAVAVADVALAKANQSSKNVKQARDALAKAQKALANPGDKFTPLTGAIKSLENNLESETSRRKPFPATSTGRRSALAKWIANRDNPLTARVAVNHIWARHFGEPLVPTVFDFGLKGKPPTHPELLNWLAVEFMENGWSMKHLHRIIVTSNAYRMTSSSACAPAANQKNDPDNRFLWRMNSGRMQSQVVRDSLLHLAGDLDLELGGPAIEAGQQAASRRRSLYFFHSAVNRNRFLTTFDEADPLDCYRRRQSITPQQALALSNSKLALAASEKITQRLEKDLVNKSTDREFAREAFTLILCYQPNAEESSACEQALEKWRSVFQKQADAGRRARNSLVHALLNHNDFVSIR